MACSPLASSGRGGRTSSKGGDMGRQQRRNAGRGREAPPDAMLEDPISATQRQTLPVLPATPPELASGAPALPEDVDTLVAPSYSRPGRRTLANATGAVAVPPR